MDSHYQRPAGSAATAGDFPIDPDPKLLERRILVLHNRDFEPDGVSDDPDVISRADVANSAQDVARALCSRGHFVEVQSIDSSDIGDLLRQLKQDPPDLVFNLIESLDADSRNEVLVPTLLDLIGVPYTGSSSLTLGLCGRKQHTKQILRGAGISTPEAALLPAEPQTRTADLQRVSGIGYPMFVKLAQEDASLGISASSIVTTDDELVRQVESLRDKYHQPILVEKYIAGRELYVGLLGSSPARTLPVQEHDFSALPPGLPHIISYSAKWDPSAPEYHIRSERAAPMPKPVLKRVEQVARQCFQALEVWDYGRCDIRLASDGTPYVIDVNPNCDLADGAGYARAGQLLDLPYDVLIEQIAVSALKRSANDTGRFKAQLARRDSSESGERSRFLVGAGDEGGGLFSRRPELRTRAYR